MESFLNFVPLILSITSIAIVGWLVKNYFPSYMSEKAKNLATKEDIQEITILVEGVKRSNTEEIERLKFSLGNQDKLLEKRREVYEEIAESLRIFISGHRMESKQKNKFYSAYSKAWLWAPDPVLHALNQFLDILLEPTENSIINNQISVKSLYECVIVEMRKDVGFSTTLEEKIRFVVFG